MSVEPEKIKAGLAALARFSQTQTQAVASEVANSLEHNAPSQAKNLDDHKAYYAELFLKDPTNFVLCALTAKDHSMNLAWSRGRMDIRKAGWQTAISWFQNWPPSGSEDRTIAGEIVDALSLNPEDAPEELLPKLRTVTYPGNALTVIQFTAAYRQMRPAHIRFLADAGKHLRKTANAWEKELSPIQLAAKFNNAANVILLAAEQPKTIEEFQPAVRKRFPGIDELTPLAVAPHTLPQATYDKLARWQGAMVVTPTTWENWNMGICPPRIWTHPGSQLNIRLFQKGMRCLGNLLLTLDYPDKYHADEAKVEIIRFIRLGPNTYLRLCRHQGNRRPHSGKGENDMERFIDNDSEWENTVADHLTKSGAIVFGSPKYLEVHTQIEYRPTWSEEANIHEAALHWIQQVAPRPGTDGETVKDQLRLPLDILSNTVANHRPLIAKASRIYCELLDGIMRLSRLNSPEIHRPTVSLLRQAVNHCNQCGEPPTLSPELLAEFL